MKPGFRTVNAPDSDFLSRSSSFAGNALSGTQPAGRCKTCPGKTGSKRKRVTESGKFTQRLQAVRGSGSATDHGMRCRHYASRQSYLHRDEQCGRCSTCLRTVATPRPAAIRAASRQTPLGGPRSPRSHLPARAGTCRVQSGRGGQSPARHGGRGQSTDPDAGGRTRRQTVRPQGKQPEPERHRQATCPRLVEGVHDHARGDKPRAAPVQDGYSTHLYAVDREPLA